MRARLLLATLSLALLAAACGGGDDGDDGAASGDTTTTSAPTTTGDGGGGGSSGEVDCEAVLAAARALGIDVQVMAQLRTVEQYSLVETGTLGIDPDKTLADIEVLRSLESVEVEAVTAGSIEESLDLYEEAARLTKENLAVDDPFTDAKGDELVALTEDLGSFLGAQSPLSAAIDAAGCV